MDIVRIANEFECSILNEAKMTQLEIKASPGLKMTVITQTSEEGIKNKIICPYKEDQCRWTSKDCIYPSYY